MTSKHSRQDKLKQLEEKKAASSMVIMSDGQAFIDALQSKIDQFKKAMDVEVEVSADELVNELKKIGTLAPRIKELVAAIDDIEIPPEYPEVPSTIQLEGLDNVTEAITRQNELLAGLEIPSMITLEGLPKLLSALSATVKTSERTTSANTRQGKLYLEIAEKQVISVGDKLDALIKAVEANVYQVKQQPDEYQPVRRVRKVGNRLLFDDDPWIGSTGGGGGVQEELIDRSGANPLVRTSSSSSTITTGTPTETTVAVTTGSTDVLAANTDRKYLELINNSDTVIYVAKDGGAALANEGTRLNANGGSAVYDTYVPISAIKAIHGDSGTKSLLVTEG